MNDEISSKLSQISERVRPPDSVMQMSEAAWRRFVWWLRRFLACNPFYLVSAALLLYGVYRVSVDPNFLSRETAQLAFNFSSLQLYEALLVITAIVLARRGVWYDSTLLVGLENLLVLAPFILISQAALIDKATVWALCLAGTILVIVRFGSLKRMIAPLDLPGRLLGAGLAVLLVNAALPATNRILHESKVGTKPDWGAAYEANQIAWLLLLPALCALANLLPTRKNVGEPAPQLHGATASPYANFPPPTQASWLPIGLFSIWIAGTGVHLYCLDYVYDFNLRLELVVPVIWILAWTAYRRVKEFVPQILPAWQDALLVSPFIASFVALSLPANQVFLGLTLVNAVLFGGIWLAHRDRRLALHLSGISLVALIGGLPENWGRSVVADYSRARSLGAAVALYILVWVIRSRDPKAGLLGSLVIASLGVCIIEKQPEAFQWACQAGLAFLLLHSLRWCDGTEPGAPFLRILGALLWVAHSFVWMHLGGSAWLTCAMGLAVLGVCFAVRLAGKRRVPRVIPIAALLVVLSGPSDLTAGKLQASPAGLLAVIASFLLFGVGTLAALTKHRWNRSGPQ